MRRALALLFLCALPLSAAVPDVASSSTMRLRGSGIYRVTGTATVETITGLRDGDAVILIPGGAFSLNSTGNISPITTTATVGRPLYFVVGNGVVYEAGPSIATVVPNATTALAGIVELATDGENAANVVVQGNDARLSNARIPTAHQATHLTGGSDALLGTLDANARVSVEKNSLGSVGARRAVNFIEGSNVTLTVADDAANEEVDITIAASGAPTSATYLTMTTDATLTAERTLAGESGIVSVTDGGAGAAATVGLVTNGVPYTKLPLATANGFVGRSGGAGGLGFVGTTNNNAVPVTTFAGSLQFQTLPSCSDPATSKLLYDTGSSTFSCGTDQTGAGSPPTVLILGADVSTGANVTPVNLTGMFFTATAGKSYRVEVVGAVQAPAATTGHGFGVNCSAAPSLVQLSGAHQLANTGTTTRWSSITNGAIVGVSSGVPTANTNVPSVGSGIISAHSSVTDVCQFIFRSEVAAVTTAKAGTVIVVTQLN